MTLVANQEGDELLYRVAFQLDKEESCGAAMKRMSEAVGWWLGSYEWADEVNIYLSSSDRSNFRYERAVTQGPRGKGYKAGRPERPRYYHLVRDYFINRLKAIEIFGYEADDALGIYQTENTVACHIDKDIRMIPGRHYDWVNRKFYNVTELGVMREAKKKVYADGLKQFYLQLLTGDAIDNIPGVGNRTGPKTAYKLLHECKDEQELLDKVVEVYYTIFKDDYKKHLLERADLLWICRKEGEYGSHYIERLLNN